GEKRERCEGPRRERPGPSRTFGPSHCAIDSEACPKRAVPVMKDEKAIRRSSREDERRSQKGDGSAASASGKRIRDYRDGCTKENKGATGHQYRITEDSEQSCREIERTRGVEGKKIAVWNLA